MERLLQKFAHRRHAGAAAGGAAGRAARRALGVIYFGSTSPAMDEALEALADAGHPPRRAAAARLPVPRQRRASSSPRTSRCSWSSRTATRRCARLLVNELEIDPARLVKVLHYDGTPITARFIAEAIARRTCEAPAAAAPPTRRRPHDLHRQAPAAPSDAGARTRSATRGATTKARSRRCAPAAATTRSRPPSSRPAGSSTSSRTASPSSRASAAAPRRRTTSSAPRTASTRCMAACLSVLTGANLANRDLLYLGVSGDGDSASIGLGQFAHAMRRGVRMAYIVENNGVYGLTKGQFSATADQRLQEQEGRGQHRQPGRPGRAWRCSWAPPTWRAASPATRRSWCR